MTIMIVDDNAEARTLLHEQLRKLGAHTFACCNGLEAVKCYPEVSPDIVIMDIAMPLLDGLEATQRICRIDPQACIYVVTAYSEDMLRRAARAAGATAYYLKDNLDSLLAQVVRKMNGVHVR